MAGNNYYVYQYITEDGLPYYIGKGSGTRIREHHLYTEVPPAERRIILKDGLTNKEAYDMESALIKFYGCKKHGGILDNKTVTRWVAEPGWKHSAGAVEKIRQGNLGKVRTEEHKQKYRKPKTDRHANNIKNAVKNLWADPEYKQKRLEKMMETRRKNGHS